MDNSTTRSVFSEITSQGFTVSSLFGTSAGAYQLNLPESPSLVNFAPSILRAAASERREDPDPHQEELSDVPPKDPHFEDEKFERLSRAHKDQAGPWITHRFNMRLWNTPKPHPEQAESASWETPEGFDGVLSKILVAPNLSRLDRSPEFHHYAYTKCVLANKKLTNIDVLQAYSYLQYLDVSSNKLTSLKPLRALPFLKILNASYNLLTTILDFAAPFFLTVANLSHNNIKQMRDLSAFWSITDLDLSHNLIQTIDGINSLKQVLKMPQQYLSSLNLSFNRIQTLENLSGLRINYLYLQNNMIKVYEDSERANLHTLKHLRIINLSYNQAVLILENVENLEVLDIVNNNVAQLLDIYYLRKLKYLNKLNLTGNPVTTIGRYLEVCLKYIKNLTLLDNHPVESDSWLAKLSNEAVELQLPKVWFWLPAYDTPPIAVIILLGLQANRRPYLAKKFCESQKNVVLGLLHTTHPKPQHEAEGEHFHYVDEPEFIRMLKEGKFSTYQEILAYAEFERAKNGIIMFHADLTMALAVKRIFFNTTLVLALPSSKEAHFEKLSILYSVQVKEDGTFKVVNSPAESEYQLEFPVKGKSDSTVSIMQDVVDEIVDRVWKLTNKSGALEQVASSSENELKEVQISTASSRRTSVDESGRSEKSEILELWWSSDPTTTMSIIIHPAHLSEENHQMAVLGNSEDDLEQFKVNKEGSTNGQVKRYVSFTVAHVHKFHDSAKSEKRAEESKTECERKAEDNENVSDIADSVPELKERTCNYTKSDIRTSRAYTTCPLVTKNFLTDGECFANLIIRDEGIRALFEEELRRRDELLELHLDMPGLFRELLFTDEEEKALGKLKTLLMDINRYNDSTPKTILDFENDPIFSDMIHAKVENCFVELRKAVSISEKQAAEYTVKKYPHRCELSVCSNPACPQWR
ncbi:hypothetical protein HUJ04_007814 [Dendroctonus ponderosae]|nr:hypothetical protein HUJ04_007814 [Dendroctonus ponderosae]